MTSAVKFNFCPACGVAAEPASRFCSACGAAFGAASGAATSRMVVGTIALALLLFLGGGFWLYDRLAPPTRPFKPGEGGPVASAPPAAGGAEGAPDGQGHPPIQLPDEIKGYIANLAKETQAKPKDVGAWQTLARVQYRASRLDPSYSDQALKSYQHIVDLDPNNLEGLRGLGNVYYDTHERSKAGEYYGKYLAIKPDDPEVRTDLGTMYYENGQAPEAIAEYKRVIAANPSFFQAYFNLGIVYDAQGNSTEARAQLVKARDLAPDDNVKGRINALLDQTKDGTSFSQAAAAIDAATAQAAAGQADGGGAAGGEAGATAPAAAPAGQGVAAAGGAPTATSFPDAVEQLFRGHPIAGPKVQKIEWPEPGHGRVIFANFPMDQMPPFMRDKYLDRMRGEIGEAQKRFQVKGPVSVDLVDQATGNVMARVEPPSS